MSKTGSGCIDEVVATTPPNGRGSTEKFNNDSDPSTLTSTPTRTRILIPLPVSVAPRSTFKSIVLVLTVTFSMIINVANTSIAIIALPTIQRELGLEEAQAQWIVSASSLTSACFLLVFGRIADVYGRKRTFIFGASFTTIVTLSCAFPKDVTILAILRGLQGIGCAAMPPAGLGILAHAFPPSRARSLAFATFASGSALGAAIGNVMGGALTEFTQKTWRSSFYFLTGLIFAIILTGLYSIDPDLPSEETDKRVDWIGAFLVTTGLVLIVFVLAQGEVAPRQWATPYIIALIIVGLLFIGFFLCWQYYLEKRFDDNNSVYSIFMPPPLMRISLWTRANGRLAAVMIIGFTTWCGFVSYIYWIQLYYQSYKQYTAMQTAVRILPTFVSGLICNTFIGLMVAYIPLVWLVGVGTLTSSAAIILFAVSKPSMPFWELEFNSIWLSVLGVDFVFGAGSLFIAKLALPYEQSMAGALFTAMTQLGTAFGIAVTTVVFNRVAFARPPGADMIVSYHAANWTSVTFCSIACVLSILFFRGVGIVGHRVRKTTTSAEEQEQKSLTPSKDRSPS